MPWPQKLLDGQESIYQLNDAWCVAEVGDGEAGEEVEILLAVGVPEVRPFAPDERHRRPEIGVHEVRVGALDDVLALHGPAVGKRGILCVTRGDVNKTGLLRARRFRLWC